MYARVAKLVDALDLGSSSREGVGVQVPPLVPKKECAVLESTRSASFLTFELEEHPVISHALISVNASAAKKLYDQTAHFLQSSVRVTGFSKGNVPLEYVKKNFSDTISTHLYEFLLKYCVTNFLHRTMRERKIIIVGNPYLHSIKKK